MLDLISKLESEVRGYVRAFPAVFDTAHGATLVDTEGKSYIDFFAGAGVLNYGHNPPIAKQALLDYLQRDGVQHGLDTATSAKVQFLRTFQETVLQPRDLHYKVQFTGPTGTNCVEAAIKLARKCKQRPHVIAFTNAYHGHTLGALALTGNEYYHDPNYGSRNQVTHLPYDGYHPNLDSCALLEQLLDDPSSGVPIPAAIIFEPLQCEGGINVADDAWMRRLAKLSRERDILLIADDIQVGNGRTGRFFSFESAGITPDLVCLSKAIGGGLPMSLLLIAPECDAWQPGEHTGTFRGNNLAFVASAALLDHYWRDDKLAAAVRVHGEMMASCLDNLSAAYPHLALAVRGRGMVWGLDVGNASLATAIVQRAFQSGLIIETAGAEDNVLKLLPPLVIPTEQLVSGLQILRECCDDVFAQRTVPPSIAESVSTASTSAQAQV